MRTAVAFVIAAGFIIPSESTAALVTVGTLWGVVSAVVQALFTVLLDRKPLHGTWVSIVVIEVLLGLGLIAGLIVGIGDHARFSRRPRTSWRIRHRRSGRR
jgi:drug/metabolite transporter (DMT)-like permease